MSMPNIPNITPIIDIDREKVVNMLMASIAMEEMGLSHIINAESEKIQYVLNSYKCNPPSIREIKEVNESVEKVMRNVTKIQFLLQEKLENVISIIPKEKEHTNPCCRECQRNKPNPCCNEYSKNKPNPCYNECSKNKHNPCCSLVGSGFGSIINNSDPFNCGTFNIVSNIKKVNNCFNLSFKYTVSKNTKNCNVSIILLAIPEDLSFYCIDDLLNCTKNKNNTTLTIKGRGVMSLNAKGCTLQQSTVDFTCTIFDYQYVQKMRIIINSCNNLFNHDSGLVPITSGNLKINKFKSLT